MDKFRILVADDDQDDFHTLQEAFLEIREACLLEHSYDGEQLLIHLETCQDKKKSLPHLIILDINMPGINGMEALKRIKQMRPLKNIPVFIYSTSRDVDQMRKCYLLGADRFITKGCRFAAVVAFAKSVFRYLAESERLLGGRSESQAQVNF